MNILIPMLGFGKAGGHRVLSKLATKWVESGHNVRFISPSNYHDIYYPTTAEVKYIPTIYSLLPSFLRFKVLRDMFGMISLLAATILMARKYDILLANRDFTAFPVWLACKFNSKARGTYYIQAYEPDFYNAERGGIFSIAKYISALTYKLPLIRIVNAPIYKSYKEIKAEWVAPPGFDNKVFYPKKITEWPPKKNIWIGCIGRKQQWKGTKQVIEAVELARQSNPKILLRIAFEIPDGLELPSFVEIVTPHGDDNLSDFYRSCDIVIASGTIQYGAFHYPSLEALACGIPLISSPYFPATVHNAVVIQSVDPELICNSILLALSSELSTIEQRIEKGKQDSFYLTWDRAAKIFLTIFKSLKSD